MLETVNICQILQNKVELDTIILTPNRRLASELLHYYANYQSNVFIKPHIIPYQDWLKQMVVNHFDANAMVLSNNQSDELWLELVNELPFAQGLAKELKKAWTLCQQWQLAIEEPGFNFNHETQMFYQWSSEYHARLKQLDAIDEAMLARYLIQQLGSLNQTAPQNIHWVHFNQFTPEQQNLIDWLRQQGSQCYQHKNQGNDNSQHYQLCADSDSHQLDLMIQWLKRQLSLGKKNIGVAIPDLANRYKPLNRLLTRHFNEEEYNISMGQALNDYPIVAQALTFLNCLGGKIDNHTAQLLLTTPYLKASESERFARWQSINELACLKQSAMKLSSFNQQVAQKCPQLYGVLKTLSQQKVSGMQSPSQWAVLFKKTLNDLGFPGETGLNSVQYQCFNRLESLFDEMIHFNTITAKLSLSQAISLINRLAKKTVFQPQKQNSNILFLGLLEASGLQFDSLWVMDMTDQCLPNPVNLSAFIPYTLQKQLQMPHSSFEKELDYAEQLLQGFINNSHETIFSYPGFNDDIHILPCPLIKNYPLYNTDYYQEKSSTPYQIEILIEDNVFAMQDNESIKGGTFILKDQALCPFKAFAKYRLHARSNTEVTEGLDALDRGIVIHRILELIWHEIESQHQLLALDKQQLNEIITKSIDDAMKPLIKAYPDLYTEQFTCIEQTRLQRLCHRWLTLEKQRPSFTVIAKEQAQQLELNGLVLNMRVDRIDQLENGEKWVIDYKTGEPKINEWFEERSSEPQLPLYALSDEEITALVFAQLKSKQLGFKGVSATDHEIEGVRCIDKIKSAKDTWQQQRQQWLAQLSQLSRDFLQGDIRIQPKKTTTCQLCDYDKICRINFHDD